jgi:MFS family permease
MEPLFSLASTITAIPCRRSCSAGPMPDALVGVGTGSASSSRTSYIVDAAPSRPEWLASVASSQGPMLGLTVSVIASGALVQFGPWPRDLIYLVCVAWRSLLPRVSVPARVRHLLPVAAAVFLATWATGGFCQAFVPALVEDQLDTRGPLILGLVFADELLRAEVEVNSEH